MATFAFPVRMFITVGDDDNPTDKMDAALSKHFDGQYAIEGDPEIVADGDWTMADQYAAQQGGWQILINEANDSEYIAAAIEDRDSRADLLAQRVVVRKSLINEDPLVIKAMRYMRHHWPEQYNAMINRVISATPAEK